MSIIFNLHSIYPHHCRACDCVMTIKGGTSQACAACKYQRRRCSKECPLAPYFPADQPEKFQHAHRLFGVRNVLSILKQVEEGQKEDAMRSVIFESAIRAQFPVRGCKALVEIYSNQLQRALEELYSVKNEIEMCKFECQQRNIPIPGYTNQEYPLQFVNDNNQEFVVPNNIYDQQPNLMINEYPLQQELDVSYYEDMALETLVEEAQTLPLESKEAYQSSEESSFKNAQVSDWPYFED